MKVPAAVAPRSISLSRKRLLTPFLAMMCLTLVGCVRGCPSSRPPIHIVPNMDLQPKYKAQAHSDFFYDGATMRLPVPGTVARGELRDDSPYFTGRDAEGNLVETMPVSVTEALVARGEQRFTIYCAPCHDARGTGKGILFQRGNVPTGNLHDQRLLDSPDGHFFDVMTNQFGLMPSYRYPIRVEDRWAIVAYVRRLQGRLELPVEDAAQGE